MCKAILMRNFFCRSMSLLFSATKQLLLLSRYPITIKLAFIWTYIFNYYIVQCASSVFAKGERPLYRARHETMPRLSTRKNQWLSSRAPSSVVTLYHADSRWFTMLSQSTPAGILQRMTIQWRDSRMYQFVAYSPRRLPSFYSAEQRKVFIICHSV